MIVIKTWSNTQGWRQVIGDTSASIVQKNPKCDYVLLYVSYTKGDEKSATIFCKHKDADIDEDIFFDDVYLDASNSIQPNEITLTESKTCVIPIRVYKAEELLEINAWFNNPSGSLGTLKIWAKPSL